ncbi:MAG: thermonuclease family protein [Campylobacteraceae bacterium]|nr:thermonuclease family protein [Campylobacteraceae bacterium]
MCAEKEAIIVEKGQDKYRRMLSIVWCSGIEINERQAQDGMAWAYRKYSLDYVDDEEQAKIQKKGLWIDNNPIEPSV